MTHERSPQSWDPVLYDANARFVSAMTEEVLALLAPHPNQHILDLGCGDGFLTEQIASTGASVIGVDSSSAMVQIAQKRGLDARILSAYALPFVEEFDSVFSNAALHWMLQPDLVLTKVRRSLRKGGFFTAEFGGAENVATITSALTKILPDYGRKFEMCNPWYFPTAEEYTDKLVEHNFEVQSIKLAPRPTKITGTIIDWLENFAVSFVQDLDLAERNKIFTAIRDEIEGDLRDNTGSWHVDYVRLRFRAIKKN